ncbi:endo alpha-1,4 polygalactosaminidase, partial [Streptomyces chartreusis]
MVHRVPRARALRRAPAVAAVCGALALAVGGCTASDGENGAAPDRATAPSTTGPGGDAKVELPEPGIGFDYQIGGAYPPPGGVEAVSRDRTAKPAPDVYNICYVNAFQAQPDAGDWWEEHAPDLVLRDDDGTPVVDRDWGEILLDTSTPAKREQLAGIVGKWIDGCADAGYQAVEADNLDSDERSDGLLTADDNVAFGKLLAARAHAAGGAGGPRNPACLARAGRGPANDFAVAGARGRYDERGEEEDAYK